jgi:hypothetical protein
MVRLRQGFLAVQPLISEILMRLMQEWPSTLLMSLSRTILARGASKFEAAAAAANHKIIQIIKNTP